MCRISVHINENGKGFFSLDLGSKILGRMTVNIVDNELLLLDTTSVFKRCLHYVGCMLLKEAVEYARMHELKVMAISRFVQKQFSSDPASYADVWEKAS